MKNTLVIITHPLTNLEPKTDQRLDPSTFKVRHPDGQEELFKIKEFVPMTNEQMWDHVFCRWAQQGIGPKEVKDILVGLQVPANSVYEELKLYRKSGIK